METKPKQSFFFLKSEDKNGVVSFSCQHGPNECNGNQIQSCGLEQAGKNQSAAVEFVDCQMSTLSQNTSDVTYRINFIYNYECFSVNFLFYLFVSNSVPIEPVCRTKTLRIVNQVQKQYNYNWRLRREPEIWRSIAIGQIKLI